MCEDNCHICHGGDGQKPSGLFAVDLSVLYNDDIFFAVTTLGRFFQVAKLVRLLERWL